MQRTAWQSKRGVSLVEVLIALTILLIVFMGLIQASILSIQSNMRNQLRDEAVAIASEQISRLRSAEYDDMNNDGTTDPSFPTVASLTAADFTTANGWPPTVDRRNRAVTVTFNIGRQVRNLDANNKQITVTVTWLWQDPTQFSHQIMTTRQR